MTAGMFFSFGKDNLFFPVGGINLNRLGRYVQTQRETILSHFVLGIDFHHWGPVTEDFISPVWVSNLFMSQFSMVCKWQWQFFPNPLILILENVYCESQKTVNPFIWFWHVSLLCNCCGLIFILVLFFQTSSFFFFKPVPFFQVLAVVDRIFVISIRHSLSDWA